MTTDAKAQSSDTPEVKPLPRRRWFQFTLRTMLAWVTVVGMLLALAKLWVAPAERQRAAVGFVKKLDGSVRYADPPAEETWLVTQLRDWLPPDYFDDVTDVDLSYTPVTDAGLVHLKELTTLEFLSLDGTQVTDAGLVHLKGLTTLEFLSLDGTQVTDAGLVHLKGLTTLEAFWLRGTQVTGAGIADLRAVLPNCAIYYP